MGSHLNGKKLLYLDIGSTKIDFPFSSVVATLAPPTADIETKYDDQREINSHQGGTDILVLCHSTDHLNCIVPTSATVVCKKLELLFILVCRCKIKKNLTHCGNNLNNTKNNIKRIYLKHFKKYLLKRC